MKQLLIIVVCIFILGCEHTISEREYITWITAVESVSFISHTLSDDDRIIKCTNGMVIRCRGTSESSYIKNGDSVGFKYKEFTSSTGRIDTHKSLMIEEYDAWLCD